MISTNQEYYIGEELIIEVVPKVRKNNAMGLTCPHIHIMGRDEGTDKHGNELGHKIIETIEFKDLSDLELFQNGLDVMQRALIDNADFKNEKSI